MAACMIKWFLSVIGGIIGKTILAFRGRTFLKKLHMSSISINIRFSKDVVIPLDISPDWCVRMVKELLAERLSLPPEELRMIFSGKELGDEVLVKDCDVGQQSIIHAVRSLVKSEINAETCCPLDQNLVRSQLTDEERKCLGSDLVRTKAHFFVYCSAPCKQVTPGKLRVRCSTCKQGTLVISRDPNCWDDVLEKGKIDGVCQAEGCPGSTAEFYFKCASHASSLEEGCAVLYNIRNNYLRVPCLACTEVSQIVLVFPCSSAHVICLECFKSYCRSRLDERRFVQHSELGYTLSCAVNCEDSFIKETHHFRLLGDEQYARYQQFATEECLLQVGGVLCPRPGCGAGYLPDPECRRVVCDQAGLGCGYVFCKSCLQGYHIGPCEETEDQPFHQGSGYVVHEEQAERSKWENASKLIIKGTTKPCPKCRTPTERDGGCMHMICSRSQCGFQWCWICQSEWTRDCMGAHWFG